eukprot:539263-Amphidinium_carterae.1
MQPLTVCMVMVLERAVVSSESKSDAIIAGHWGSTVTLPSSIFKGRLADPRRTQPQIIGFYFEVGKVPWARAWMMLREEAGLTCQEGRPMLPAVLTPYGRHIWECANDFW